MLSFPTIALGKLQLRKSQNNAFSTVIDLLTAMKTKIAAEGTQEGTEYAAFVTWCNDTKSTANTNIDDSAAAITAAEGEIEAEKGNINTFNGNIQDLNNLIAETEADKDTAQKNLGVVTTDCLNRQTDMADGHAAVESAKATIQATQTNFLQKSHKTMALMLLQKYGKDVNPDRNVVENHSGGVINMLDSLAADFQKKIQALNEECTTKKKGLTDEISGHDTTISNSNATKDQKKHSIGRFHTS
jgi:chromosome segregation ATPase